MQKADRRPAIRPFCGSVLETALLLLTVFPFVMAALLTLVALLLLLLLFLLTVRRTALLSHLHSPSVKPVHAGERWQNGSSAKPVPALVRLRARLIARER